MTDIDVTASTTTPRRGRPPASENLPPAGLRIAEARLRRNVRLCDLAAACGRNSSQVSNMIRGRERITPELAVAAEDLLGLDAAELIRLDHEQVLAPRLTRVVELRARKAAA